MQIANKQENTITCKQEKKSRTKISVIMYRWQEYRLGNPEHKSTKKKKKLLYTKRKFSMLVDCKVNM